MTIANTEMAAAWDGGEGDHWTEFADRYDAAGARIWQRFLDADLIRVDDRILDVGCGTGQSSRDAARIASSGSVLGVDLSSRMLAEATRRTEAAGVANVEFIQADAQVHPFERDGFDLVISRSGAMFFNDRAAAFANFAGALRSGGRIALLAWRGLEDNEWLVEFRRALALGRELPVPPLGAPGPFGLADEDGVTAMLAAAGFADARLERVDEPMTFGSDYDDAWSFARHIGIVKGLTESLNDAERATAIANVQAMLKAHETPAGVTFASSSWLITARKP